MDMARRAESGFHRGRVWRHVGAGVVVSITAISLLGGAAAQADEPAAPVDTQPVMPVETGEIDGVIVAVDTPPVPPTTIEVAVGEPPVPVDAVEVAVGEPPVPPVTIPDAVPPADPAPAHVPDPAPVDEPDAVSPDADIDAVAATAIVADAAASVSAALWSLALRS
jgi:hypothetical protein